MVIDPEVYELTAPEIWWRDRYSLLESHGYRLRPRYKQDWTPSWVRTNEDPEECEDSICTTNSRTIDATRISDGKIVLIKKVIRDGRERKIAEYLTDEEKRKDRMNHCVPILDHFNDDQQPYTEFIVMPMLRPFDNPPFSFVDEVVDFVHQTLEALSFIHSQNVAHRDFASGNIMFDGEDMYPSGFHPVRKRRDLSGINRAVYSTRRAVKGVKYYVIDFGISTLFEGGQSHLVTGCKSQDPDIPELSDTIPYDAFAVDVFTLGNIYKKELIEKFVNLDFLSSLIEKMVQEEPKGRPSIDECVHMFSQILSTQTTSVLYWKLKEHDLGKLRRFWRDITSTFYVGGLTTKRLLVNPLSTHSSRAVHSAGYLLTK